MTVLFDKVTTLNLANCFLKQTFQSVMTRYPYTNWVVQGEFISKLKKHIDLILQKPK